MCVTKNYRRDIVSVNLAIANAPKTRAYLHKSVFDSYSQIHDTTSSLANLFVLIDSSIMPYPILKLPYGLQRRLRSLTTQKELYHLQIAVGSEKHHLAPFQICKKYSENYFYLQNNDGNLDLSTNPQFYGLQDAVDWKNNNLTLVKNCLYMTNLQEGDTGHPIFDNLLIDCYSISFWFGTVVNPTILRQFAKHCNTKATISFNVEDGVSSGLTVPLICDVFENIKEVYLRTPNYAYNRWMQEILQYQKLNLNALGIRGHYENLFSFEPDELWQLYRAQTTKFFLALYCDDPPADAVELVRQKLGIHFKEFTYKKGHIDGVLYIKLNPEVSGISQMWFQIGPETNRVNYNIKCTPYSLKINPVGVADEAMSHGYLMFNIKLVHLHGNGELYSGLQAGGCMPMLFPDLKSVTTLASGRYYLAGGQPGELFELPLVWHPHITRAGCPQIIVSPSSAQLSLKVLLQLDEACRKKNLAIVNKYH
uniref:DUF4922 domain-containing protein n=1 Tax=Panagrellus redivivus TaxID=6233 RepID=A0A7E4VZQ0_PANRE